MSRVTFKTASDGAVVEVLMDGQPIYTNPRGGLHIGVVYAVLRGVEMLLEPLFMERGTTTPPWRKDDWRLKVPCTRCGASPVVSANVTTGEYLCAACADCGPRVTPPWRKDENPDSSVMHRPLTPEELEYHRLSPMERAMLHRLAPHWQKLREPITPAEKEEYPFQVCGVDLSHYPPALQEALIELNQNIQHRTLEILLGSFSSLKDPKTPAESADPTRDSGTASEPGSDKTP